MYDYEKIKENPLKTLNDLARKEEEQNRRDLKLRQQADYRTGSTRSFAGSAAGGSKRPSMSADYLNDETQFEGENLSALKKSIKAGRPVKREPRGDKPAKRESRYEEDDDMADEDEEEEDNDEMVSVVEHTALLRLSD